MSPLFNKIMKVKRTVITQFTNISRARCENLKLTNSDGIKQDKMAKIINSNTNMNKQINKFITAVNIKDTKILLYN